MKFKDGDKVKILTCSKGITEEVQEMIGGVFEIKCYDRNVYSIYNKDKSDWWYFAEEDLELAEEKPKNLIPEIAKMLGVDIGEEFYLKGWSSFKHRFINEQLEVFLSEWTEVDNETYRYVLCRHIIIQKLPKKPQLTEDEKVILRNLPKKFKWIMRGKNNYLFICIDKPQKGFNVRLEDIMIIPMFEDLFQFIKWEDEEPYNIEELLKEK